MLIGIFMEEGTKWRIVKVKFKRLPGAGRQLGNLLFTWLGILFWAPGHDEKEMYSRPISLRHGPPSRSGSMHTYISWLLLISLFFFCHWCRDPISHLVQQHPISDSSGLQTLWQEPDGQDVWDQSRLHTVSKSSMGRLKWKETELKVKVKVHS